MENLIKRLDGLTLVKVGFVQAFFQLLYVGIIALFFWKANEVFGRVPNYIGPLLFLLLFSFSVIVSGVITLGYPFVVFWVQKKPKKAIRLVINTALWLFMMLLLVIIQFFFSARFQAYLK